MRKKIGYAIIENKSDILLQKKNKKKWKQIDIYVDGKNIELKLGFIQKKRRKWTKI